MDKIFLDNVNKRYKLQKEIKLINFQSNVNHICGVEPKIGLQTILKVANITNENEHDALYDVKAFKKAFKFMNYSARNNEIIIKNIIKKQLRPKNKNLKILSFNKIFEPLINDDYGYIIYSDSIKSNRNDKGEIIEYLLEIEYKKYNTKKNIIDQFSIKNSYKNKDELENHLNNFYRNYVHNNLNNNVLIINPKLSNLKKMINLYSTENNNNLISYIWFDLKFYKEYKNKYNEDFNEKEMLYFIDEYYNKQMKKFNK